MDQTDILITSLKDDDDLRNYFEQKEAGDKCEMTVKGTFLGIEEENARISITGIDIGEYKVEEDEDEDDEDEEEEASEET